MKKLASQKMIIQTRVRLGLDIQIAVNSRTE